MAKSIGAVRFENGDLVYFLWNHFSDHALPKLFATVEEAEAAWDVKQARNIYEVTRCLGGDQVELTTWYEPGKFEVVFRTRADRKHMVLVGPLDLEGAWNEYGEPRESGSALVRAAPRQSGR